jgi:hypothetical protein
MRIRRSPELVPGPRRGTIGGLKPDPLQGEGTEAEIRDARQAQLRERRVEAARKGRWTEIPADQLERYGKYLAAPNGLLYLALGAQHVWSSGDPRVELNGHDAQAFTVEDGDVLFLKEFARREDVDWIKQDNVRKAAT